MALPEEFVIVAPSRIKTTWASVPASTLTWPLSVPESLYTPAWVIVTVEPSTFTPDAEVLALLPFKVMA